MNPAIPGPAGGAAPGVDRLCMPLGGAAEIDAVRAFPG
jgi:lysyl-tRNA synthetase class II